MSAIGSKSPLPTGQDEPLLVVSPPGPQSRRWLRRAELVTAPMGPARDGAAPSGIVYAAARGTNVLCVDGNRYVDLAAGFGALLLGHGHAVVTAAVARQSERLLQALGDVHPADLRVVLQERLRELFPLPDARVVLGQSGADAITVALKTALLCTGRPGVLAFSGSYHGLSYAPLAACGLRQSYVDPFRTQLNPEVRFVDYPLTNADAERSLLQAAQELRKGSVGAVLVEPVLGRGGCIVPPSGFLRDVADLCRRESVLLVTDEIWTGLGRAGSWSHSLAEGVTPDLLCLGKGLGGGIPISACVGSGAVMSAWRQPAEVVHTSTFAGAPLACAAALATLEQLASERLVDRAAAVGRRWRSRLGRLLPTHEVRGAGLMVGLQLTDGVGAAARLAQALLRRGYLVSTGGGQREVLVLTPPLNVDERLLEHFDQVLSSVLREAS